MKPTEANCSAQRRPTITMHNAKGTPPIHGRSAKRTQLLTNYHGGRSTAALVVVLITIVQSAVQALALSVHHSSSVSIASIAGVPASQIQRIRNAIEQSLVLNGLSDPADKSQTHSLAFIAETGISNNGQVHIVLIWEIRTNARTLGTIVQSNQLPNGRDVWCEIADLAIPAAVPAIHKLIGS